MKRIAIRIPLLILLLPSCQHTTQIAGISEPMPVDSFLVKGISVGQQVQHFQYRNDGTLSSYDKLGSEQVVFRLRGSRTYEAASKKPIQTEIWSNQFYDEAGNQYFIDRENYLAAYNQSCDSLLWSQQIYYQFPHLKDDFSIYDVNNAPILMRGDTMICSISHGSLDSYQAWFKEHAFSEFVLKKDTVLFLRSYMPRPAKLNEHEFPFETYYFLNNSLFVIYPPFDTLYIYNRASKTEQHVALHNRDYHLPEKFDPLKATGPGAGSYQTHYTINNFKYASIYYNAHTKHTILFYYAPMQKPENGKMVNPKDQKLRALVLDENMEHVAYYSFNKPFVYPNSFFSIPNKGIAIPRYKGNSEFEETTFYIYDF